MKHQSTTSTDSLTVEQVGKVSLVRMHHGEDNRFHPRLLDALDDLLDSLSHSEEAGALVITGTGRFFSNGLDLDYMAARPTQADETLARVHALLGRILGLDMPTVAAVNGHAFAAGAMLMLACDAAVMRTDRGYICLPEADLGLPFSPGMSALLTARLSPPVAHEAMVTSRRYDAASAIAAGLVTEAASSAEVTDRAVARATELAGKPRSGLAKIKLGLYGEAIDLLAGRPV